ncbi:hypothetical protein, partial [Prevotella pectinovora]|uniref:hypothetical protein n=1 Tax=Prevotella pectinovora TaxID=1602169 RepID=UPI003A924D3B
TAWGMKPHIRGFCSPRRGGFLAFIFVFVFWGNSFKPKSQTSISAEGYIVYRLNDHSFALDKE